MKTTIQQSQQSIKLLLACCLFTAFSFYGHAQNLLSSFSIGGKGLDAVEDAATDKNGDIIIIGRARDTINLDAQGGNTPINNRNENQYFLAKYTQQGQLLWHRALPTGNNIFMQPRKLSINSKSTEVYVSGIFSGNFVLNPENIRLTSSVRSDLFIARINALNGQIVAVKSFNNTQNRDNEESLMGLFSDGNQNVYMVGNIRGSFDANPDQGTNIINANSLYTYLIVLNRDLTYKIAGVAQGIECVNVAFSWDYKIKVHIAGYISDSTNISMSGNPVRVTPPRRNANSRYTELIVATYSYDYVDSRNPQLNYEWHSKFDAERNLQAERYPQDMFIQIAATKTGQVMTAFSNRTNSWDMDRGNGTTLTKSFFTLFSGNGTQTGFQNLVVNNVKTLMLNVGKLGTEFAMAVIGTPPVTQDLQPGEGVKTVNIGRDTTLIQKINPANNEVAPNWNIKIKSLDFHSILLGAVDNKFIVIGGQSVPNRRADILFNIYQ